MCSAGGVFSRRRVHRRGALLHADARRRQAFDVRIVAHGAADELRVVLAIELLARREPALEAVAVHTPKVENDHFP